jgi:hypothetical protein
MLKAVNAFLWRRCNKATIDSLVGDSRGQYHITLKTGEFDSFFRGINSQKPTDLGGYDYIVRLESFTGTVAVERHDITIRYMGAKSARKDWNIPSQRPESAYELWRVKRAFFSRSDVGDKDFIIIARDINNGFHGRWIRSVDYDDLPDEMKQVMNRSDVGWQEL